MVVSRVNKKISEVPNGIKFNMPLTEVSIKTKKNGNTFTMTWGAEQGDLYLYATCIMNDGDVEPELMAVMTDGEVECLGEALVMAAKQMRCGNASYLKEVTLWSVKHHWLTDVGD